VGKRRLIALLAKSMNGGKKVEKTICYHLHEWWERKWGTICSLYIHEWWEGTIC
jgi:hypothetical protein